MNKKSQSVGWNQVFYAFVTVIVVGAAIWIFYPKILSLADTIKSTFGLGKAEVKTSQNNEPAKPSVQKEIKGQLQTPLIVKMDNTFFDIRPTSKDYCLVGTVVNNTGTSAWDESDKIRITLFCKNQIKEDQINRIMQIQNYPSFGYLKSLGPGEKVAVSFLSKAPNNCLNSFDTYKITLYSNCQGNGNQYQPCDNQDSSSDAPKIINEVMFNCKVS